MSFLFKATKKGGSGTYPAPTSAPSRDVRSPDGTNSAHSSFNGKSASPISGVSSGANHPSGADRSGATSRTGEESHSPSQYPRSSLSRDEVSRSAAASPEQKTLRDSGRDPVRPARPDGSLSKTPDQMQLAQQQQRLPLQARPPGDPSPYPWSQRQMTFSAAINSSPFPRYGAAVNAVASKDGSVYLMGGLINGSTVKGDLWMVEAGPGAMTCYPVATTSEGPGPRVGHASLLVGNAFIVFGGDTKMDEGDLLDDTLYLLNTSTKQWSRALPAGPRPPGRYGHTLNILGSKIYIFGGQVEGYFFNDLVAFDLNALQQATNRWEILIQNTIDGGPPHGQIPPARTNHTMVTWGDRLYLFGGTDGIHWFNDVWSYSPHTNSWTQLECIGYIPSPREGHAAALVGDVMYIFGGRTEDGNDLGDLAAFRISSRRWYTFQNMGPSPSPRSGHSMTTVGKQIVVLAGEPSSAPRDPVELGLAYFLDTNKIRYPADNAQPNSAGQTQGQRRPSTEANARPMMQSRVPPQQTIPERSTSANGNRVKSPDNAARLPMSAQGQRPAPTGPPPQAPGQAPGQIRPNGAVPPARQPTRPADRALSPSTETTRGPRYDSSGMSPTDNLRAPPPQPSISAASNYENDSFFDAAEQPRPASRQKPETYQPSSEPSTDTYGGVVAARAPAPRTEPEPLETSRRSIDTAEPLPRVQKISEEHERPQDSGLGSSPALTHQYDVLARELEQARQKNAWFTSELALARKSGYQSRDSPILDDGSGGSLNDDDRPLVEALLKMRAELSRVQETIDEQSRSAAERIAEMEKQRDVAINEAVFAKAKLAGQTGSPRGDGGDKSARTDDISRRLASALEAHSELNRRYEALSQEIEAEKKAREFAEDTAEAAQKRVTELDAHRQQHAIEVANLRAELHETQTVARAATADHSEIASKHKLLIVDHDEMTTRFQTALTATSNHTAILASLKDAVAASSDKAQLMEKKLEEERAGRAELERTVRELNAQQAEHASQLENSTRALREAEELARTHAEEARTHRSAVLAGLGHVTERDVNASQANDQRIVVLQEQVEAANALARQNQNAADTAADKLRRAEERIAGLEAYQEQASREGLSIRKQLQTTMKENNNLTAEKAALEQKMERHKLETNALSVQHASLKDILGERGVNASEVRRSRAIDSPSSARFSTPDPHRFRELEQNYETSLKNHDELRAQYEEVSERNEKMKRDYEEKLIALDNDHQAAVKYLRGTEKMLSKLKQELQRVKTENSDLKKKVDKAKDESESSRDLNGAAGIEAAQLRQELAAVQASLKSSVGDLENQILSMQSKLQHTEAELAQVSTTHASTTRELSTLQTSHSLARADLDRLQKENSLLEHRAKDAEDKVQLLLDQVEHSVDNYRRQSRISASAGGGGHATPLANGHHRGLSADTATSRHHSRGTSLGGESAYDDAHDDASELTAHGGDSNAHSGGGNSGSGNDARNSLALDSLANELETLRSHWETAKNYRLSDRFDFERGTAGGASSASHGASSSSGTAGGAGTTSALAGGASIANWRHALGLGDDDDDDDEEDDDDDDDLLAAGPSAALAQERRGPAASAAAAAVAGKSATASASKKDAGNGSEGGSTPRMGMI